MYVFQLLLLAFLCSFEEKCSFQRKYNVANATVFTCKRLLKRNVFWTYNRAWKEINPQILNRPLKITPFRSLAQAPHNPTGLTIDPHQLGHLIYRMALSDIPDGFFCPSGLGGSTTFRSLLIESWHEKKCSKCTSIWFQFVPRLSAWMSSLVLVPYRQNDFSPWSQSRTSFITLT